MDRALRRQMQILGACGNKALRSAIYSFVALVSWDSAAPSVKLNSPPDLRLFEETILPHLDAAYNLARWLVRSPQDAQDIVQESFLRAFRFFPTYRGADSKAWLFAIVRNTCATWARSSSRLPLQSIDETVRPPRDPAPSVEERLSAAAEAAVLRNCIDLLPPEFREAIVMRELEEMSYRQIAEAASVPEGTVMSRLARARKRLEECARRNQK